MQQMESKNNLAKTGKEQQTEKNTNTANLLKRKAELGVPKEKSQGPRNK